MPIVRDYAYFCVDRPPYGPANHRAHDPGVVVICETTCTGRCLFYRLANRTVRSVHVVALTSRVRVGPLSAKIWFPCPGPQAPSLFTRF